MRITKGWNKQVSKHTRRLCALFVCILFVSSFAGHINVSAASSIKVRYYKKTVNFTRQQLGVTVDGTSVSLSGTPGLSLLNSSKQSIYMVPAYDVFQKALGASYSYSNGKITLKKWNITIKMTLNSKTAYVNGKKTTLSHAPLIVKYMSSGTSKVLVPANFVATTFGYGYSYASTSSNTATIKMTTPFYVKYDGTWRKYSQTQAKVSFDGTNISVTNMPAMVINSMFYVQAKAFANSSIGGTYGYNNTTKVITLKYGSNTLKMTIGSKTATLNGKSVTLSGAPKLVVNGKSSTTFVMVPMSSTCTRLGLSYAYKESTKTCAITRKDSVYFSWLKQEEVSGSVSGSGSSEGTDSDNSDTTQDTGTSDDASSSEEGADTSEDSSNSTAAYEVNSITAQRKGSSDVITIEGNFPTANISDAESGNTYKLTLTDTANAVGKQSETLTIPYLLKSLSVTETSSQQTVLTLKRKNSTVTWSVVKSKGKIVITLEPQKETTVTSNKNGIVIAVDAGHGDYTAGKRTPPILTALDFNNDGKIDAAKGSQIREHTGNVGVAEYAVKALERCGFTVYKSSMGSTDVALTTRQANIKAAKAQYSISIHFNASGTGSSFNSAQGIEIFTHKTAANAGSSKSLASALLAQVAKGTTQTNRGVNSGNAFAMCNTSAMGTKASVLLECAFMTNWNEVKNMMASEAYWEETGEEIAKGFCNYLGITYVEAK